MEILSLQKAHLPPKNSHENSGMLWYHFSVDLQLVQCEAGKFILSLSGRRYIKTLLNEPIQTPKITKNIAQIIICQISSRFFCNAQKVAPTLYRQNQAIMYR